MPANKQPGKVIDNMYDFLCYLEEIESQHRPFIINRLYHQLTLSNGDYYDWINQQYPLYGKTKSFASEVSLDFHSKSLGKRVATQFAKEITGNNYRYIGGREEGEPDFMITPRLYNQIDSGQFQQSRFYLNKLKSIYKPLLSNDDLKNISQDHTPPETIGQKATVALTTLCEVMTSDTTKNKFKAAAIGIAVAATIVGLPAILFGLAIAAKVAVAAVAVTATTVAVGKVGFFAYDKIKNACKKDEQPFNFAPGS